MAEPKRVYDNPICEKISTINQKAFYMDYTKLHFLIEMTKQELTDLLHYNEYNSKWDNIVVRMLNEKINKGIDNEGINSVSYAGIVENYSSFYSDELVNQIKANRKIKIL